MFHIIPGPVTIFKRMQVHYLSLARLTLIRLESLQKNQRIGHMHVRGDFQINKAWPSTLE